MASSHNLFSNPDVATSLEVAVEEGTDEIFLLISAKEGAIPNSNPRTLKNELVQFIGDTSSITSLKYTRQGKISVSTRTASTAQKILGLSELLGIQVNSFMVTETVTTRFLLHNMDPTISCQEISDELRESGITVFEVRRFLKKNDGQLTPTRTILVTKLGPSLPSSVKLWFQNHRVTLFWDKPRPCMNCFRYNHGTKGCSRPRICKRCGEDYHEMCPSSVLRCSNCNGEHAADDKSCPTYSSEIQLQKYKSSHNLTIGEARRRFSESDKSDARSFARVTATPHPQAYSVQNPVTMAVLDNKLQELFDKVAQMIDLLQSRLLSLIGSILPAATDMSPPPPTVSSIYTGNAPTEAASGAPSSDNSSPNSPTKRRKRMKKNRTCNEKKIEETEPAHDVQVVEDRGALSPPMDTNPTLASPVSDGSLLQDPAARPRVLMWSDRTGKPWGV